MLSCRGVQLLVPVLFLLLCTFSGTQAEWKWGDDATKDNAQASQEPQSNKVREAKSIGINNEEDTTLDSDSRSGRSESYPDGPLDDNHPRFLGGLKKKLCSIGLGFKKSACYCTKKPIYKKKVRVARQVGLKAKRNDDILSETQVSRVGEYGEPEPRFLGAIGDFLSKIPIGINLQLANIPTPGHTHSHIGGTHTHPQNTHKYQPAYPFYVYKNIDKEFHRNSPSKTNYGSGYQSPAQLLNKRQTSLVPTFSIPDKSHHFPTSLPGHGSLSSINSLKAVDKKLGLPLGLGLHGPLGGPLTLPLLPSPHGPLSQLGLGVGPLRHPLPLHATPPWRPPRRQSSIRNSRVCQYYSCRDLHSDCQRQLAPPQSLSCRAFEVCCILDQYQGSFSDNVQSFTNTGQCGIGNSEGVTGRIKQPFLQEGDAKFGEYPWQAAVLKKEGFDNVYVCAGTLIDNRHILTAAHCITGYQAIELRARLGEWDVNRDTEFFAHFESDAIAIFEHPEFYDGNLINDIAIIRIDAAVDFLKNPHIGPICMPRPGQDFTGQRCIVTGWGKDGFGDSGQYQNVLKEVELPVIGTADCQSRLRRTRLGSNYRLHPGMICAGGEVGKDSCKGDGGGPLSCAGRDGRYYLGGLVSWGIGCGTPGIPGVYVNIAYYLDWIRTIVTF